MNILTAQNVSYRYRRENHTALAGISLAVPQGSSVALLGPNGAGKTTLLDIILGWKRCDTGSILVEGKDPAGIPRREAGKIMALTAQSEHITFSFSVLDYVLFARAPYISPLESPKDEDYHIAWESLRKVNMDHLAGRIVTHLSGGELQLVKLARSIAQQPRLLLLDEPTSDLDPANTSRVLDILYSLIDGGTTLVFTTHDPMLASDIATHTALLRTGCLLYYGFSSEGLTKELLEALYRTPMEVAFIHERRLIFRGHQQPTSTN